jgi:hypothetical protein
VYSRKLVLALVALVALAALAAGCGGGSSSSSESSSTTSSESGSAETESNSGKSESSSGDSGGPAATKAAFIKEADKICGKADAVMTEEITDYAEENGIPITEEEEPSEDQEIEIFHAVILPNIGKQAEEIAALTPPQGDEVTIEDLTDSLSQEVSEAADEDSVPDGSTLQGATEKAHAYGLKICGS